MFRRLVRSQQGFTLIEVMASLVILMVAMGAISQVFINGVSLVNRQSSQMDLRSGSRHIMTQMEKDIQAAASVDVVEKDNNQEVQLKNKEGDTYETYLYVPTAKTISRVQGGDAFVLAYNVQSASFNGLIAGDDISLLSVPKVSISVTLAEGQENLDVSTTASPRWNAGIGVPALVSVTPNRFYYNSTQSQYVITSLIGINTHFSENSKVTIKDGSTVFATTDLTGHPKLLTSPNGITIQNATLYTLDGGPLPFGFYDLYVETPLDGGGKEVVYSYSVLACTWNPDDWLLTAGASQSSGFNSTNYPYVVKDANNNDKVDYYVQKSVTDFEAKVAIQITPLALASSGADSNPGPDAEMCLWEVPGNGAKNNTYVGFGINKDSVYIRDVFEGNSSNMVKVPGITITNGRATLRAVASGGNLTLYVDGQDVTALVKAVSSSRTTYATDRTGYLGVTAVNNVSARFAILRM